MQSRAAIVTGGARGLGAEMCRALARRGNAVVVADRDAEAAALVADSIVKAGGQAAARRADVTSDEDVEALVGFCAERFGAVGILVTSAGIGVQKRFLDTTREEFERIVSVNLTGTFLCCRHAAQAMLEAGKGGRIVTIASAAGLRGIPGRAAYASSKAGVINLTRVLATELGMMATASGAPPITVNCVAPGPVESDLTRIMHTEETRQAYVKANPLGRYGTAAEIAAAVVFLASEDAAYITGQTVPVDGGSSAAGPMFKLA